MAASPEHGTVTVSDIGEAELIRRFFEDQPVANTQQVVGIGDDCAVLDDQEQEKLLVTTDQLVERIHFIKDLSSPSDIGYKSVAVNFSDIAAMGGRPIALFLSLGLPADTPISWVEEFSQGLFELCRQHEVQLLGGDTTGSRRDIIVNITAVGKVRSEQLKLRSGAKDGEVLCVTGTLGDSAAGLRLLTDANAGGLNEEHRSYLLTRHLRPRPALEEGRWLGEEPSVHAMMDLSDGLATDAGHIAARSDIGMEIDLQRIPVSDAFKSFMSVRGGDAVDLALNCGEDYHLLCSVSREAYEDVAQRFEQRFDTPLYAVGTATAGHKDVRYHRDGEPVALSGTGFDHFNPG